MKTANEYQADGFVKIKINHRGALAEANRQLNVAKKNTPESIREQFSSSIRFIKAENGYSWVWFVK